MEKNIFAQGPELLRKKSLSDEAFELLHRRIVAGQYSPGEWLRQEELSNELGVSQTPVREALDRLAAVGLAEKVAYKGVRVRTFNAVETIDTYILRLLLETSGVRLAAYHITPQQVARLRELVTQSESLVHLDDMPALRQVNLQIHRGAVAGSGNAQLTMLYEQTANIFPDWMLYEYMFRHPELLQASLDLEHAQHCRLVDAIAAGDPDQAAARAQEHLRHIGDELVDFLGIDGNKLRQRELEIAPMLARIKFLYPSNHLQE